MPNLHLTSRCSMTCNSSLQSKNAVQGQGSSACSVYQTAGIRGLDITSLAHVCHHQHPSQELITSIPPQLRPADPSMIRVCMDERITAPTLHHLLFHGSPADHTCNQRKLDHQTRMENLQLYLQMVGWHSSNSYQNSFTSSSSNKIQHT